jgi:lysozyme
VRAGEHFDELTRDEALALLASDLAIVDRAIARSIQMELGQNQHDAIASWAFNVGVGPLANSGVARALNSGDWDGVCARLLDWSKMRVRGELVVNRGLYVRRVAESELFAKPDCEGHPAGLTDHLDEEERDAAQAAIAMSIDRSIRCYFDDRE